MSKELNLSGLKLLYGGLIVQLISVLFTGRLATGLMNGAAASGILSNVIRAVSLCIILAGLSRLTDASPFFGKARVPFLVQLAVQILLIFIFAALGRRGWSINDITTMPRSTVIEMIILTLIILVISIVAGLFSVRSVLRGCGHVAEQVNDPLFSIKCLKSWRLWYLAYLLTILMILAGVAVIVTVLRKTMESGAAGEDLSQAILTNVSSSVLLVSLVVLVVLGFFLIAHILYLGKVRITYREYHLEEVKNAGTEEQRPVLADYVQRELGGLTADEYQEDMSDAEDTGFSDDEEENLSGEDETDPETEENWGDTALNEADRTEKKLISGRKYRRVTEEADVDEEQDPEDILEIAKLFKKNKN